MIQPASHVNDSPHERQLKLGFAALRFQNRLEQVFRQDRGNDIVALLRLGLLLGLLLVCVQMTIDYLLTPPEFHRWSLGLGAVLMAPSTLLALALTKRPVRPRLLAIASMLVALSLGVGFLVLDAIAPEYGIPSRFAGFLVVTFYIYYLLGLLFWQAFVTAIVLISCFVLLGVAGDLPAPQFANSGLLVGFSNLIGMLGLYVLEHGRRTAFLREGILDFRAGHDGLTGLKNRDAFNKQFDTAWRVAKRERKPIAVMMIDIDFFKDYNDVYGHQAGDKCLQSVAKVLLPVARRPLDFVGRYGGEEFVIFLTGSIEQYAIEAAERIRTQVQALRIRHQKSKVADVVTVSIGLAHLEAGESERSKEGFLQLADEALYRAKDGGRNQVLTAHGTDKDIKTGIFRRAVPGG